METLSISLPVDFIFSCKAATRGIVRLLNAADTGTPAALAALTMAYPSRWLLCEQRDAVLKNPDSHLRREFNGNGQYSPSDPAMIVEDATESQMGAKLLQDEAHEVCCRIVQCLLGGTIMW